MPESVGFVSWSVCACVSFGASSRGRGLWGCIKGLLIKNSRTVPWRETYLGKNINEWLRQRKTEQNCLVPRRLSRCARKGRREGDNGRDVCTLPMVPCGSSPVTRFALASAMRKTKRLRRRLGTKGFVLSNAFIQFNFHKYLFTQELSLNLTYSFYLAL